MAEMLDNERQSLVSDIMRMLREWRFSKDDAGFLLYQIQCEIFKMDDANWENLLKMTRPNYFFGTGSNDAWTRFKLEEQEVRLKVLESSDLNQKLNARVTQIEAQVKSLLPNKEKDS